MEYSKLEPDKKDKSGRLKYLEEQKNRQEKRKDFYTNSVSELKKYIEQDEYEIGYNKGWIDFHNNSIERHKKCIHEAKSAEEKKEQEEKLQFHINQIEEHHKKNVEYHNREIDFAQKEVRLFEYGLKECDEQLVFVNKKLEENKIS